MELWIRSQDRETIMKIDRVDIDREKEIWVNGYDVFVAKYKTKERALEVLDEIQDLLVPKLHHVCDRDLEGNEVKVLGLDYIQSIVYEMPKE